MDYISEKNKELKNEGTDVLVSSSDAAKVLGCTPDHIARLCRKGELRCVRIEKRWKVYRASLDHYSLFAQERAEELQRKLSEERKQEYQQKNGHRKHSTYRPTSPSFSSHPYHTNKIYFISLYTVFVFTALPLSLLAAQIFNYERIKELVQGNPAPLFEEIKTVTHSVQQTIASATRAPLGSGQYDSSSYVALALQPQALFSAFSDWLWGEPQLYTPPALGVPRRQETSNNTTTSIERTPTTVIRNVTEQVTVTGVSNDTLITRLQELENKLRSEILVYSARSDRGSSGNYRAISLTNAIHQLTNTTITTPTVSGGSFTDGSFSGTFSGPISGGTGSFSTLTASGATTLDSTLSAATTTLSGALTVSGTATSSIAGQLGLSFAPTEAHTFGAWATGVASSSAANASLYINPSTATADSNLFGVAVNGAVKFLVDAEGDIFANSLTASGGVTLATTTASTFTVEGDTTLGDAATDNLTITARLISDLIPKTANTYDLGTTTLGFRSGFFNTSLLIGNTATTTIRGDQATSTFASGIEASRQITAPFFQATSTSATSTFAGDVTVSGKTTLGTASTTQISATYASSTNAFFGSLSVGSLTGFLKATAGSVATSLIDLTSDVSGILGTTFGGTGWGTITANTLLVGNGTNKLATTTAGTNGQVLALVGGTPSWVATTTFSSGLTYTGGNVTADLGTSVDLTSEVTGTLPVSNGGTGATTFTNNRLLTGNSTSALVDEANLTFDGSLLTVTGNASTTQLGSTGSSYFATSGGNVGIGTTTPNAKLAINTGVSGQLVLWKGSGAQSGIASGQVGGANTLEFTTDDAAGGQATRLLLRGTTADADTEFYRGARGAEILTLFIEGSNGNVGIGSTTPFATLAVNPIAGDTNQFVVGSSTATSFIINSAGNVGVGVTDPDKTLEVFETVADSQLKLSYDATRYTTFQVTSVGDLVIDAQGGDASLLDENLFVCAGGSCPAGTPTGTGNFIVERGIGVASATPITGISVGADSAIVTTEKNVADAAPITIDWDNGNQQLIRLAASRTVNFSNVKAGQTLRLTVCTTASSRLVTWGSTIRWSGGTAPTQTATANKCDVFSFLGTLGHTGSAVLIFGASTLNF